MKKISVLILTVLISSLMLMACGHQSLNTTEDQSSLAENPAIKPDGSWNEYLKLRERYYYLDEQEFNEIQCLIVVPIMTDLIEKVKSQLSQLKNNVEIKENLSSFALIYSPISGLSFSDPEFDIVIKSKEGIADIVKFEESVDTTKNGFKMQVDGVKDVIKGLFSEYHQPQEGNYKDLVVVKDKDASTATFVHENNRVVEKYFENTIEVSQYSANTEVKSIQKYVPTNGNKLIFKQGKTSIQQPDTMIIIDITVEYQQVKNVVFPELIKAVFEQTFQTINQKGSFDIHLKNFEIK